MIIIDFEFLNCDKRDVNLDGTQLTNDYGRSTCDNEVLPLDGSMTQNLEENAAKIQIAGGTRAILLWKLNHLSEAFTASKLKFLKLKIKVRTISALT